MFTLIGIIALPIWWIGCLCLVMKEAIPDFFYSFSSCLKKEYRSIWKTIKTNTPS